MLLHPVYQTTMPKKDPWARPSHTNWIAVGKKVIPLPSNLVFGGGGMQVRKTNPEPRDMPVFVITRIETTGNGARMIHLALVESPDTTTAKWQTELLRSWKPAPRNLPSKPRPKKERKSRFERESPV